ncbi:MAG: membrane protease HflC [Gammaproteobacteria bacterium SG8_47]|nr:MAG: membrane protease HflC [Gammaproteobacteria bacterium SG8_47]
MAGIKSIVLVGLLVIAGVLYSSMYVVDEREVALMFQLGEVKRADVEPGIYFKLPFVNNVRKFDGRILTLDAPPANYLTAEKKNVNVDFFVKWRISDVKNYYRAMLGSETTARERVYVILNDGLRSEFSNRTIQDVISGERRQIMSSITKRANEQVGGFGIEIVDVRIKRIDFTAQISDAVYQRMVAERARVAKDLRARGAEAAEKIRADADRQKTVLLAEAYREAQQTRGEGDAKASEIYANAFSRNAEFFSFYRSLNAYRNTVGKQGDVLVIEPDSDFFRYFNDSRPGKK